MTAPSAPGQPPGQLQLLPPAPASTATSYRIVTPPLSAWEAPDWSDPIRDLPVAASRAAVAAGSYGTAWLVAADDSGIAITTDSAGDVVHVVDLRGAPLAGWALRAARIINQKGPLAP